MRLNIVNNFRAKPTKKSREHYNDNRPAVPKMIMDRIWYVMPTPECPKIKEISEKYKVSTTTLYGYLKLLKQKPLWVPNPGNKEAQQVFTKAQKEELAESMIYCSCYNKSSRRNFTISYN